MIITHQICIQSIQTVACVRVVVWLRFLTSDKVHDLMFPFPWCLKYKAKSCVKCKEVTPLSFKIKNNKVGGIDRV